MSPTPSCAQQQHQQARTGTDSYRLASTRARAEEPGLLPERRPSEPANPDGWRVQPRPGGRYLRTRHRPGRGDHRLRTGQREHRWRHRSGSILPINLSGILPLFNNINVNNNVKSPGASNTSTQNFGLNTP
ncbi:hypothetical protein [Streptomyces sp. NBC_01205]|uniref:hypothetical protein n=1 Tax=Streptomyces sp. NBC_01205 TaxID=2903771 RepID=UPI002E14DB75|nr:hypothetical protein OG573_42085 [Streptomyces sp. NBC_01205]